MKILEIENDSIIANGALLRGEQVFTSMLYFDGRWLFFHEHLERLLNGADFLFPNYRHKSSKLEIADYIFNKIKLLPHRNYYCRITIVEESIFVIFKEHEISHLHISLANAIQVRTANLRPPFLKLSQYGDSFLELKKAKAQGIDDVVYFDQNNFLTEATTSNVLVVNERKEILTPYLSSMVLAGIIRAQLMDNFVVIEKNITREELLNAREIWLTNSIKGLRFVESYLDKKYIRKNSIFDQAIERIGRFGEKIGR